MREPTTTSTHIIVFMNGFEPGPHWWEASALTTVCQTLISNKCPLSRKYSLQQKGAKSLGFACCILFNVRFKVGPKLMTLNGDSGIEVEIWISISLDQILPYSMLPSIQPCQFNIAITFLSWSQEFSNLSQRQSI